MSYLDHIRNCNTFTPEHYLPFMVGDEKMGDVLKSFAQHLLAFDEVFQSHNGCIRINPFLTSSGSRSSSCKPILKQLHHMGVIDSWVGELYSVTNKYGEEPRFLMERAAVSFFGIRGYGVHINGLVQKPDGIYIWVAVRARDKPFWPGLLDQMVAGGQPAGIGRLDNVIKECAEEANIPKTISSNAKLVSQIHYCAETHRGLHPDTLFNYDIWLPEDFIPENTDGEVDEFILMPLEEMAELTESSDKFKSNCNLVNIDLLLRQGLINKAHKDYNKIKKELYAPAT